MSYSGLRSLIEIFAPFGMKISQANSSLDQVTALGSFKDTCDPALGKAIGPMRAKQSRLPDQKK